LKKKNIPHLLLYGPSGSGKTLILKLFIKEYYGDKNNDMILELNSNDERGIKIVRERINTFSKKSISNYYNEKGLFHKLVILHDAESITNDAQTSLRRCIETNSKITRFIIICNDKSKIIEPIASRCCQYFFSSLKNEDILNKLNYIIKNENIEITQETKNNIINITNNDIRKAINMLQYSKLYSFDIINEKYENYNIILNNLFNIITNNNHNELCKFIETIINQSIDIKFLILKINHYIISNNFYNHSIINDINLIYNYIDNGCEPFIQLLYLSYLFI
jgi:replication factor C subunit 2/4